MPVHQRGWRMLTETLVETAGLYRRAGLRQIRHVRAQDGLRELATTMAAAERPVPPGFVSSPLVYQVIGWTGSTDLRASVFSWLKAISRGFLHSQKRPLICKQPGLCRMLELSIGRAQNS